ncbi:hypothetical protein RUM44_011546 [Polyplax serrata]|uniref:Uncharacterized protein n=1 Tax=Polyplax serrata TaxID=468196 RepID=A0ABR1AQC7_POLSC
MVIEIEVHFNSGSWNSSSCWYLPPGTPRNLAIEQIAMFQSKTAKSYEEPKPKNKFVGRLITCRILLHPVTAMVSIGYHSNGKYLFGRATSLRLEPVSRKLE